MPMPPPPGEKNYAPPPVNGPSFGTEESWPGPLAGQGDGRAAPARESEIPDMEVHTSTLRRKHMRLVSPGPSVSHQCSFSSQACRPSSPARVRQAQGAMTPRVVGPARTTFRSAAPLTPLTHRPPLNLLSSLNLFAISPPPPPDLLRGRGARQPSIISNGLHSIQMPSRTPMN